MGANKLRSRWAALVVSTCLLLNKRIAHVSSASVSNLRKIEHNENSNEYVFESDKNRQLSLLSAFFDPTSVETKPTVQHEERQATTVASNHLEILDMNGNPRALNILSFGGATTQGSTLSNPSQQTYPKLIGSSSLEHVDDLSPGTGSSAKYPGTCLETLLSKANLDSDQSYDLILVEYASRSVDGVPLLLHRLRERYPDAVIVFIELFCVFAEAIESGTGSNVPQLGNHVSIDWVWRGKYKTQPHLKEIEDYIVSEKVKGYIYEMPKPDKPIDAIEKGWFAADWIHLSKAGHEFVANDIIDFLNSRPEIALQLGFNEKRVEPMKKGDQCYNWFLNGIIPPSPEFRYEGATMYAILQSGYPAENWSLHFSDSGGYIKFNSKFPLSVPVVLGYLTHQIVGNLKVEVMVNDRDPVILDPNHFSYRIQAYAIVGMATPGENILTIKPQEGDSPFKVTGLFLGGVNFIPEDDEIINGH